MILRIFKRPPKLPRHGLITQANERWAQYMGSIFWPWDKNGRTSVYDWKTICSEIQSVREKVELKESQVIERKNEKIPEPKVDLRDPDHQKYMRDRRRYWVINSLTKNLHFSKAKAKMQNEYRHEFAREVDPVGRDGNRGEKTEDERNDNAFYALHEQLTLQSIGNAMKSNVWHNY